MNSKRLIMVVFLALNLTAAVAVAQFSSSNPIPMESTMTMHASGTFDVKIALLEAYNKTDPTLGRMSIDKQLHGDLEATSKGEMLSAGSAKGSGGYVAIERVNGTLNGRTGSFALQHSGTMTNGAPQLSVTVVPGSGTGELTGIAGKMTIKIEGGKHFYTFDYSLGEMQ